MPISMKYRILSTPGKNTFMLLYTGLMIRLTQDSYSVQEDFGSFELCTRITSGQIAPELDPVTIDLSVVGGTAQSM